MLRPRVVGVTSTTLSGIVPRWEWRTFGEHLVTAERRLAAVAPEQVHESDDLYLVARHGDDTAVKVRDALVDVKRLVSTGESGLEQWVPVMKEPFPLSAACLGQVLSYLYVRSVVLDRATYTLLELLDLVSATEEIVPVEVSKRRTRYRIHGCMAEVTEACTDRGTAWTVAVESEDPALVVAAAAELGLGSLPNLSYPAWLRMLVGCREARFCVIDVGTNSVKFHIGERATDGSWRTVVDRAEVTRLGEGLDQTGGLQPEPMKRTADAIAAMVDEAQRSGVIAIVAVGTAGLRIATNSSAFLDAVEEPRRDQGRDHPRRGGRPARLRRGEELPRPRGLRARGVRLGRGQLSVHLRPRRSRRRALQRGRRCSTLHRAVRPRPALSPSRCWPTPSRRSAPTSSGSTDVPAPDALVGMGGAMTNLAAVQHGLTTLRPRRRAGNGHRRRRDRPADRALPAVRPQMSAARSWGSSRSVPR